MSKTDRAPPTLKLLAGGLDASCSIGHVVCVPILETARPPTVDARIIEQDTYRLLADTAVLEEPRESLPVLETAMHRDAPATPGTILLRRGQPQLFNAIVHDLDEEPSWSIDRVTAALAGAMTMIDEHHVRTLACPLLATRHGNADTEQILTVTLDAFKAAPACLKRVWLTLSAPQLIAATTLLKAKRDALPTR